MDTYTNIITCVPRNDGGKTPAGAITGNGDMGVVFSNEDDNLLIHVSKCDFWKFMPGAKNDGGIKAVCTLKISGLGLESYETVQQLKSGRILGKFKNAELELFVTPENRLYLTLTASEERAFPLLSVIIPDTCASQNFEYSDSVMKWYMRKFSSGALERESAAAVCLRRIETSRFDGVKTVRFCLGAATRFDSEEFVSRSVELAMKGDYERDRKLTAEKWETFFKASSVRLPDERLERHYNFSLYYLACCMGNSTFPPGLFGNFITDDFAPWRGDYHMNYNYEAPFYPVFSSNHPELFDCYCAPLNDMIVKGKAFAELFGCKGICLPVSFGPKGLDLYSDKACKEHGIYFLGQKSHALYACVIPVMHWRATRDKEYALQNYYEFMVQTALFWEDYLVEENGRFVIVNDAVHEIEYYLGRDFNEKKHRREIASRNGILSLGLLSMLLECLLDISAALGKNRDKAEKWRDILARLSNYPTFIRRAKRCFRYTSRGLKWKNVNSLCIQHVYPASRICLSSEKRLLKIARNTFYAVDRRTDDNGSCSYLPAGARLGAAPEFLIDGLNMNIDSFALPNLLFNRRGGCLEHMATVPATVNEMLLQSCDGVIRVFPCFERSADASFSTLRADDGFLVSSKLSDGRIEYVKIKSLLGLPVKIYCEGGRASVKSCGGRRVKFSLRDGVLEFKTRPGEEYEIK